MTARPRLPGSTNAPGGPWYATPASRRHAKPCGFTLPPSALAALTALCAASGASRSSEVAAALLERAARLLPPPPR